LDEIYRYPLHKELMSRESLFIICRPVKGGTNFILRIKEQANMPNPSGTWWWWWKYCKLLLSNTLAIHCVHLQGRQIPCTSKTETFSDIPRVLFPFLL